MVRFMTTTTLAVAMLAAPLFGANDKDVTYLALGDSIAFGYDPTVAVPAPNKYVGYPEKVAQFEFRKEINAACPGETSGSFLVFGARDNHCQDFKNAYGLHTNYPGVAQASFAASELASNKHINLVTLSLGGNDLLLLQQDCSLPGKVFDKCVADGLPAVLATYGDNLHQILTKIRTNSNYQGTLVVMTSYVPNTNSLFAFAIGSLNSTMIGVASSFHVKFADAFDAFQIASLFAPHGDPCAAGLLIRLPTPGPNGACDVHPSPLGRDILALTVLAAH